MVGASQALTLAALLLLACGPLGSLAGPPRPAQGSAFLLGQPAARCWTSPCSHACNHPRLLAGVSGTLKTVNAPGRQGSYYLPGGYQGRTLPAAVLLHGSAQSGAAMVAAFRSLADAHGFIIIAPDSASLDSWEPSRETSPDEAHVARCLAEVQGMPGVSINAARILVAGFSGATAACPLLATTGHPSACPLQHCSWR